MTGRSRYGQATIYACLGLIVVLALATLSSVNNTADAIRKSQTSRAPQFAETNRAAQAAERAAKAAELGTRRIQACTTPGRKCYDHGQSQLAGIIAGLTDSNQRAAAAAVACLGKVSDPADFQAVYGCVLETLAAAPKPSHH